MYCPKWSFTILLNPWRKQKSNCSIFLDNLMIFIAKIAFQHLQCLFSSYPKNFSWGLCDVVSWEPLLLTLAFTSMTSLTYFHVPNVYHTPIAEEVSLSPIKTATAVKWLQGLNIYPWQPPEAEWCSLQKNTDLLCPYVDLADYSGHVYM